jgi:hypothetical protein
MIFKLTSQLAANTFYLGRLHPFNADAVFKVDAELTIENKNHFCIFLDLIRSLIEHSELKLQEERLLLFGVEYAYFDVNQLMEILAINISNSSDYFKFIFEKIDHVSAFKSVISKLDEEKLTKLFENAAQ